MASPAGLGPVSETRAVTAAVGVGKGAVMLWQNYCLDRGRVVNWQQQTVDAIRAMSEPTDYDLFGWRWVSVNTHMMVYLWDEKPKYTENGIWIAAGSSACLGKLTADWPVFCSSALWDCETVYDGKGWHPQWLDGFRAAIAKAAEIAESYCRCHEGFTSRDMMDPACSAHDIADDIRAERMASDNAITELGGT